MSACQSMYLSSLDECLTEYGVWSSMDECLSVYDCMMCGALLMSACQCVELYGSKYLEKYGGGGGGNSPLIFSFLTSNFILNIFFSTHL